MDYEQDYTRLNRNQILWYGNDETSAATGGNASGQQTSAENNGTRDMILDNEDFNWRLEKSSMTAHKATNADFLT